MRGINKVILMGNLGADPVLRHTPNGKVVCDLRIATHHGARNADGDKWEDAVMWHTVRLWEQKAELALRFLTKGCGVIIEGSMRDESWTDKGGQRQHRGYILGDSLHLMPGERRPEPATVQVHEPVQDQAEIPF